MNKLLFKFLLFLSLLVLIKLPFSVFYRSEINYREAALAKVDYNLIFAGSSRTKTGVIPAYFDELTERTQSYNAGVDAGLPPQTFEWCAAQIEKKQSLKYVFVELSGEYDFPVYEDALREFSFSEYRTTITRLPFEKSEKYHDKLTISFFKPLISIKKPDYNHPLAEDWQMAELSNKKEVSSTYLQLSRSWNQQVNTDQTHLSEANLPYWEKVARLVALAEAHNVKLYFLVPPRLASEEESKKVAAIYAKLPEKYRLTINHADESLYRAKFSADDLHLNRAGAKLFTEILADAFNKMKKEQ